MSKFKYLRTAVTRKNYIDEEMTAATQFRIYYLSVRSLKPED